MASKNKRVSAAAADAESDEETSEEEDELVITDQNNFTIGADTT